MPLADVENILCKYTESESRINAQLGKNVETIKSVSADAGNTREGRRMKMLQAIERNKKLLQDVELAKGKLRSMAIFSPSEIQWEEVCRRYCETKSLPATTWRCHLPVFV